MKNTASDFLIRRINEWGLKRIYGYPGDGINGIVGALDRADGAVEYVQVRHEEMAAFMAGAGAKITGGDGHFFWAAGTGAPPLLKRPFHRKKEKSPGGGNLGPQGRGGLGGGFK